jgi:hypothetical protein
MTSRGGIHECRCALLQAGGSCADLVEVMDEQYVVASCAGGMEESEFRSL